MTYNNFEKKSEKDVIIEDCSESLVESVRLTTNPSGENIDASDKNDEDQFKNIDQDTNRLSMAFDRPSMAGQGEQSVSQNKAAGSERQKQLNS